MRPRTRILTVGLLIVLLGGLCIHYGATYDDNWPYPSDDALLEDPEAYDGEDVLLIGTVLDVDRDAAQVVLESDDALEIVVEEVDVEVVAGGTLQVYGELSERASVHTAESVIVVNEGAGDRWYKNGVSGIAGLITAGLFVYYWRIDWRTLSFRRRDG